MKQLLAFNMSLISSENGEKNNDRIYILLRKLGSSSKKKKIKEDPSLSRAQNLWRGICIHQDSLGYAIATNNSKTLGAFIIIFLMFILFWESTSGGGAERGGQRIDPKRALRWQADSSEPDAGLELTKHEIMTWAEVWRSTDWAPQVSAFKTMNLFLIHHRPLAISVSPTPEPRLIEQSPAG